MEKIKKYALWFFNSYIWLGVLILIIDIVTKNVIVANKDYIQSLTNNRIDLIPGFLGITYTVNTNAAFGLGTTSQLTNRILYIIMATIASGVMMFVYVKYFKKLNRLYRATILMMFVGAFGNLIDRVFFTTSYLGQLPSEQPGVVDWIDFYGIWPYVFNIADSSIVIGTIMLIVVLFVDEFKDSKKRNQVTLKKDIVEQRMKESEEAKLEAQKEEAKPEEKPQN